jgi:hypothetical protein
MKKYIWLLPAILILLFTSCSINNQNNIACTQEAKLCPDGSYVGRTGPNCEFQACTSDFIKCINNTDCQNTTKRYICHNGICTNPIDNECTGVNDKNCPTGYQCVQYCVGEKPEPFYCQLNGTVTKKTCD